jgi:hypothetical protein
VGRRALANPFIAGIAVGAVGELRVAGNRLQTIGPDAVARLIAGIYVAPPVPQIALDDNTVRRIAIGGGEQQVVGWVAILVFPVSGTDQAGPLAVDTVRTSIGTFSFLHAAASTFLLSPTHLVAVDRVPSDLSVRGNRLHARDSRMPLVVAGGGIGTCLFSDNHCRVDGQRGTEPVHGLLTTVVNNVANNRLSAETDRESLRLVSSSGRAVVLGNISSGRIRVNNGPIPAPFDQLNLLVP